MRYVYRYLCSWRASFPTKIERVMVRNALRFSWQPTTKESRPLAMEEKTASCQWRRLSRPRRQPSEKTCLLVAKQIPRHRCSFNNISTFSKVLRISFAGQIYDHRWPRRVARGLLTGDLKDYTIIEHFYRNLTYYIKISHIIQVYDKFYKYFIWFGKIFYIFLLIFPGVGTENPVFFCIICSEGEGGSGEPGKLRAQSIDSK